MMDETQRMLAGKLTDPRDPVLMKRQHLAHRLSKMYSDTFDDEHERRAEILRQLLPDASEHIYFQGPIFLTMGIIRPLVSTFMAIPTLWCWIPAELRLAIMSCLGLM